MPTSPGGCKCVPPSVEVTCFTRPMARNLSIAAVNFAVRPVRDFEQFADHVKQLLKGAHGFDLVVFPELFTVELFSALPDWQNLPISELTQIDKFATDYVDLFKALARERGQHIVAGSHLMSKGPGYLNVAHLFAPDEGVLTHDKTHIFPAEADWHTGEGDSMEAFDLPFARVGFNVCYEAEIPECASTLVEQGAEIIISPLLHVHGVRLLAGAAQRPGPCHREPGVRGARLYRR